MKAIERYIYAVTEHMPEDIRADVSKELRANIEDMLPENPTQADVYRVLEEELGNPWKLAEEYNPRKRYLIGRDLIGPALYNKYLSVLKVVLGIVISVLVSITMLVWVLNPPIDGGIAEIIAGFLADVAGAVVQGALHGAIWVTISFVVLEKTGIGGYKKKWSPQDLPALPVGKKGIISRGETIFAMCCTILFAAVIVFQPQVIALYFKSEAGLVETPLFALDRLQEFLPVIILFTVIQLGIFVWKYVAKRWSIPLAITHAAYNAALCVLLVVMLRDSSLFNDEFFSAMAAYFHVPLSQIDTIWSRSITGFAAVFIAISVGDAIANFFKCRKSKAE